MGTGANKEKVPSEARPRRAAFAEAADGAQAVAAAQDAALDPKVLPA